MEPPKGRGRSREETRSQCGDAVALILATELGTEPLIVAAEHPGEEPITCITPEPGVPAPRPLQLFEGEPLVVRAVSMALRSQVSMVYVLTDPTISQRVNHALMSVKKHKSDPFVQVVECEPQAMRERQRQVKGAEVFGIPFALLEIARAFVGSGLARNEAAIIVPCDLARVTEDHLFELVADYHAHPGTDIVASWVQWLRRPPFLFSADFLDRYIEETESRLQGTSASAAARAPLARYAVRDHVFGEEQLAANAVPCEAAEAFLSGATMSALQAVTLARYAREHPSEELHSPNQPLSLTGSVKPKPLEGADKALVRYATEVLEHADGLDVAESGELDWADGFGCRNRRDFPLLNDRAHAGKLAYLDSAATSQRLGAALQAQRDFDEHENANVYRGAYDLSAQATFTLNTARKRLEDFIGAKRRTTVYTANATASMNLVAQAWGEVNVGEGDLLVTTVAEHHSCMLPLIMLAERKGARVEYLPYDERGRIDQVAYEAALEKRPKLVALAQIGNVLGIEAPIKQMAEQAHAVGARLLVDAAQSFAHKKIDVAELGADWVAFSAHKAYGPMGLGGLWISDEAFAEMEPIAGGGGTISHVGIDSYYLRTKVLQYEGGTPAVSQAVGFAAAIDYLDALGMENIARHDAALTRYLVRGLSRIEGVSVLGDHLAADGQNGLVSFAVSGVAPAQVAGFLGKLGVAIRAGGHCALPLHASLGLIGSARASIGVYTTRSDIDALLVALRACVTAFSKA